MLSVRARIPGIALCLVALSACSRGPARPEFVGAPVPFERIVLDERPPGGPDCCTDVLAVGDLDDDGLLDLVVGSEHAERDGLVWYRYPTWERRAIALGQFTTDGKVADLDGDGWNDVVVGDSERGLLVFGNPGASGSAWSEQVIGEGYVHDIALADFDRDGRIDIVTCDKEKIVAWLGLPDGAWRRVLLLEREGEGIGIGDLDRDGDPDLVTAGIWLETPALPASDRFAVHEFAPGFSPDSRVRVVDMNADGRLDAVLTASEGPGPVAWFEAPADPREPSWIEHRIASGFEGAHTLDVGDLDRDGDLDLLLAEMHTSRRKRVLALLDEGDGRWSEEILSRAGSHNALLADLDADGDLDVVGKNYAGAERPLELWRNLSADGDLVPHAARVDPPPAGWAWSAIDDARDRSQYGMMGLVLDDIDRDGRIDVVAGSILYLNPGASRLGERWPRVALPEGIDVMFAIDVDGDPLPDLIGLREDEAFWLEAERPDASAWRARPVATVTAGRSQGTATGQLVPGGRDELIFTRAHMLAYLVIPEDAANGGAFRLVEVSRDSEEEGVAIGDLDGDGDLDLVGQAADWHRTVWHENLGGGAAWLTHELGLGSQGLDRVVLADLDGDGDLDVVVSEETRDLRYNARLWEFEAPGDPHLAPWSRRALLTLRSINSVGVGDVDGDGLPDLVLAEHTDQEPEDRVTDNLTAALLNRERGSRWELEIIEIGPHSSHLGARLADIDGDGDLDVVSSGWQQYRFVHLWLNPRTPKS